MTGSDLVAAKIMKKARKMLLKSELFRKGGVKHMAHRTLDGAVLTGNIILLYYNLFYLFMFVYLFLFLSSLVFYFVVSIVFIA